MRACVRASCVCADSEIGSRHTDRLGLFLAPICLYIIPSCYSCVCACVRACVRARVRACVCVCARARVSLRCVSAFV